MVLIAESFDNSGIIAQLIQTKFNTFLVWYRIGNQKKYFNDLELAQEYYGNIVDKVFGIK